MKVAKEKNRQQRGKVQTSGQQKKSENLFGKPALWLGAIKTFFQIVVCAFSCFCLLVAVLFYTAPSADVRIFKFFGMTKAEEKAHEQLYAKTGSTSALYNLILFEMEQEDYEKELNYILEIYEAGDYDSFCSKLNKFGVVSANGNKSLYVYVADTKAFLMGQEMKCKLDDCLATKNRDLQYEIIKLINKNLTSGNLTENTFCTFTSTIYKTDKLTLEDKKVFIDMLSLLLFDEKNTTLDSLVKARRDEIISNLSKTSDEVEKILLSYSNMNWSLGLY